MSPAHAVALYLASQGVGTFGGSASWSINVSREPVSPVDAVTLYDTGGPGPDTDDMDVFFNTFQVRVRSANYASAHSKQEQIRGLLLAHPSFLHEDVRYAVNMETDIMHLGRDDNDRHLLTANYRVISQEG